MPSRSRKLMTAVTLSVDGGPAVDARRKAVGLAIRGLADGRHQRVELTRFSGVMSFARSGDRFVVTLHESGTPLLEPLHVLPSEAADIARVYHECGELHESFHWRECEDADASET